MRLIKATEDLADLREATLVFPEIDRVGTSLEIDLDEDEAFVVLTEYGFQESATAKDLLQHQIVRRRQVVEVVLRRGCLRCSSDLVPHTLCSLCIDSVCEIYHIRRRL